MTEQEFQELTHQTRIDGKRLFGVSEYLYKAAIFINWIIAIGGGLIAIYFLTTEYAKGMAFIVALIVVPVCLVNYILAVLSTHIAKVLVHTSLGTIALVEILKSK